MTNGFYLFMNGKDVFVASERKNVTDAATLEILNRYQNHINKFSCIDDNTIKWAKNRMQKATCELVTTENGFKYHKIETAYGTTCAPLNDDTTIIIL